VEDVCVVEFPEGNYTGQITPYGERHGWGEMRQAMLIIQIYFYQVTTKSCISYSDPYLMIRRYRHT
jgi:hypothetical protein